MAAGSEIAAPVKPIQAFSQVSLGGVVPPLTAHAISVSLPTWKDVVGYEEGDPRVVNTMETGYPRFFIHRDIQKLAGICEQKFGTKDERCLLLPSLRVAEACRSYMIACSSDPGPAVPVRLVQYTIHSPEHGSILTSPTSPSFTASVDLHITLFPADAFPLAKQFWQHAGLNISSRVAKRCLSLLGSASNGAPVPTSPTTPFPFKYRNRHYATEKSPLSSPQSDATTRAQDEENADTYLEERYGRNLSLSLASQAKRALRRRIAQVLTKEQESHPTLAAGDGDTALASSTRVKGLSEDDVFLFPTGMSAIWSAHQLALATRPSAKSVCFGFPYTDTLKILEKWGPGCHFLGRGVDADIETLETTILSQSSVLALFTEFPSNPLLRCADLRRLRALADKHDFLVVVDETIGNFANVEILPFADIVVSSLTKIFSGDANVMGGSLVLNPKGHHYDALKRHMKESYEDIYFDEDAIFLERNSRDFQPRTRQIDSITEAVCDFLHSHSLAAPTPPPSSPIVIKNVFYPKYTTAEHYEACRLPGGGYGGLFSLTFTSLNAAQAFYDALDCYKGPSLGTNFTLACPYSILAHYAELDWAAQWDVETSLVRVSVGMEDQATLMNAFDRALKAAQAAGSAAE